MTTISLRRGKTSSFTVTVTDSDGSALDLTDKTLAFTAKREFSEADDDAVISKTTGDGIATVIAADGTARVTIDPEDTRDLDVSTVYWDIIVDPSGASPRTALTGRLVIKSSVLLDTPPGS